MFEYIFTNNGPEVVINTENFCENIHDVKHEVLKHTPECLHRRSTYPNGFIIETEQYSEKIIIRTNWELSDNGDNTFSVIVP